MPVFVQAPARRGRSVAVTVLVVLAVLVGAGRIGLRDLLPSLPNPFGSKTVDHSQPPLRTALTDLSRYQAASSNLQVIVDSEKDASFLPSFVRGDRTVFVAAGSVDATVDFSGLDDRSIVVSEDRRSFSDSPSNDRKLYVMAQQKMEAAAARDGELRNRAADNTRHMLETMLHSLGYANVAVNFATDPV